MHALYCDVNSCMQENNNSKKPTILNRNSGGSIKIDPTKKSLNSKFSRENSRFTLSPAKKGIKAAEIGALVEMAVPLHTFQDEDSKKAKGMMTKNIKKDLRAMVELLDDGDHSYQNMLFELNPNLLRPCVYDLEIFAFRKDLMGKSDNGILDYKAYSEFNGLSEVVGCKEFGTLQVNQVGDGESVVSSARNSRSLMPRDTENLDCISEV